MKNILSIIVILLSITSSAQINANSVLKLRNVTALEMNAIVTPNTGSVVFNTDDDGIYKFNGTVWTKIDNSLQSIVLNRDSGLGGSGSATGGDYTFDGDDNYHNFPVGGDASQIQEIDTNIFEVIGDGRLRVLEDGVYFISGGISTEGDFPNTYDFDDVTNINDVNNFNQVDDRFDDVEDAFDSFEPVKYVLGVFLNGTANANIIGFLTRGFVSVPDDGEFWGTSGVLTYKLSANDVIRVRYRIDAGGDIDGWFTNIGMTKMQ